jgi:hypothetical protein
MEESGAGRTQPLWKTADLKADKYGPHHSVFSVRKDREFETSKRLGVPAPKGSGPYLTGSCYTGDWVDNRHEGYGSLTKVCGSVCQGRGARGRRGVRAAWGATWDPLYRCVGARRGPLCTPQ